MSEAMPQRLLVVARSAEEIGALIRSAEPSLAITARSYEQLEAEDACDIDMLVAFRIPPTFGPLPDLRLIQSTGAGIDGILAHPDLPSTARLARIVDGFGPDMAEYVLARCLAVTQGLADLHRDRLARRWRPFVPRRLAEVRVVVVGVGVIGGDIGRCLASHGAQVIGVSRGGAPVAGIAEVVAVQQLDGVLPRADFLVLVAPHTTATRHLIDARRLALLPRGAFVINVGRGSLLDEAALAEALHSGHVGGAALDVFESEPLPQTSPLWSCDEVMISPHIAGVTRPAQAAEAFVANYRNLLAGRPLQGEVDRARGY